MKRLIFTSLIFLFLFGCKSKKENFDPEYFNGYWLTKIERENYQYPNINFIQDSVIDLFYVSMGHINGNRFELFSNDTLGISWNYGKEDEYFTKSKFTIISRDTFLASNDKANYIDSLFRISKEEAEKIIKEWEGEIEIEPPRTGKQN